jgi:hypothetical protein
MTKASDNPFPSILVEEGAEPSAPAAGKQRLYIDSSTHKLKRTDSSGTDVTIEGSGPLNKLDATAAPAVTDDSGDGYSVGSIWVDVTGDDAYICVDASVGAAVWNPFEGAGAGGPLLYVDSLDLGADGDEFADMTGWTAVGNAATTDEADLLTYDDTAQLISTGRSTLGYYKKAAPDADGTFYLTVYGVNVGSGTMIGFGYVTDSSGSGVGIAYRASSWWGLIITSWAYGSTPTQAGRLPQGWNNSTPYNGAPIVLRLIRAGGNVATAFSEDGGVTWTSVSSSTEPSAGAKSFVLAEFYENGPNYILVGRLTVV